MRKRLLGLFAVILATTAQANPMLDVCLPFAPKSCSLTKDSVQDAYLTCFENVMLRVKVPMQWACASELLHARLHKACDKTDIPTLCVDVKPGENRTMNCLASNASKLTKPCSDAYTEYMKLEKADKKKRKGKGSAVGAVRC